MSEGSEFGVNAEISKTMKSLFLNPDFFKIVLRPGNKDHVLIPKPGLRMYHNCRLSVQEELKYDWIKQVKNALKSNTKKSRAKMVQSLLENSKTLLE